jgi:hypothetical protein
MLHARWQIDARFGHKQDVIERLRTWARDIAPQAGLHASHLLAGSIGALEATVEHNWHVESLADLERAWAKLGTLEAHRQWGQDLEPFVVSGTAHWTVWRVL